MPAYWYPKPSTPGGLLTFWDFLRKPGDPPRNVAPRVVRIIKSSDLYEIYPSSSISASTPSSASPAPSNAAKARQLAKAKNGVKNGIGSAKKPAASPAPTKQQQQQQRKRPARTEIMSSSDEGSSDEKVAKQPRKKQKSVESANRNATRQLHFKESEGSETKTVTIKHAQEVVGGQKMATYMNAFEGSEEMVVELKYPGDLGTEKFQLVRPRDKDDFDPVQDILKVTELVPRFYLSEKQVERFLDESNGIHRKLKRAVARKSLEEFRGALTEYNKAIQSVYADGTIAKNLDAKHELPLQLVEHILTQIYARTVSLKVDSLRKYENGTDNVYGELLPRFGSKIFRETGLTSDHVFLDLGSGVGNVVLQAALEIGCESWGCEVMDNACDLAALQEEEFRARCRAWGLATGRVHLERGDLLKNSRIRELLPKADVILVNNQAFTPQLNDNLVNLFLDLKEGCRIVSLKSFVPPGHKITKRNVNSPINGLEVEEKRYYSDCVSWTSAPGEYFVATKDSRKLKEFTKNSE